MSLRFCIRSLVSVIYTYIYIRIISDHNACKDDVCGDDDNNDNDMEIGINLLILPFESTHN